MNRIYLILFFSMCVIQSCVNDDFGEVIDAPAFPVDTVGQEMYIVCEGLFGSGNGEISCINLSSQSVTNNMFQSVNGIPLGDVPLSLCFYNNCIYIMVNNSGKIVKTAASDMSLQQTIGSFVSPRYALSVGYNKMYISIFNNPNIKILDLQTHQISGNIYTGRSIEKMIAINDEIWCCNWSAYNSSLNNNCLLIIDPMTDLIVDSLIVGKEPNSLVIDAFNNLWVLCSGGYNHEEPARLICIDPTSRDIVHDFIFNSGSYPSRLSIDGSGLNLYWIDGNVYKMNINDVALSANYFIPNNGRLFYGLAVNPLTNDVWVSNAVDYLQEGYMLKYSSLGHLQDSFKVGIIPGEIYFK